MHWLLWSERSARLLEEVGFCYDSTWGYNEAVGFRSGTAQAFRPVGATSLLELPLHIQDTALFAAGRMNLTQEEGIRLIDKILDCARRLGGVVTVNWHMRSLGPERFWEQSYQHILRRTVTDKIWTTGASQVVEWFEKRRSAKFSDVDLQKGRLCVSASEGDSLPSLELRLHNIASIYGDTPFIVALDGNFELASRSNA
jgi:hypothetical protein